MGKFAKILKRFLQEGKKKWKIMKEELDKDVKNILIGFFLEGTETDIKDAKETLEEESEDIIKYFDKNETKIGVNEIKELQKILLYIDKIADTPKNDSLAVRKIHNAILNPEIHDKKGFLGISLSNFEMLYNYEDENAVDIRKTIKLNENRNGIADKSQPLAPKHAAPAIRNCTHNRSLEYTTDSFLENLFPLKDDVVLVVSEVRESPHNFHVPLNMLDLSSHILEDFRGDYVSFQLVMQKDSIICNDKAAMLNLKRVMKNVRQRMNGKAPRSRIHFKPCPEIFEEACRQFDIKVERLECDKHKDLLRYKLYFPSGCRMVLAIPMNNPKAMDKK